MLSSILGVLIAGIIIGLLGKFLAPGDKDNIPLWLTILCGIGGALVGTFLYEMFFASNNEGIMWWKHIWQVAVATVLVIVASTMTGRNTPAGSR